MSACGFGRPGLALRGADLADASLADVLDGFRDPGFDRDAPTVAVAEGVLMYLPPDAVAGLWRGLRAHCAARVGVIASTMACDGSGVGPLGGGSSSICFAASSFSRAALASASSAALASRIFFSRDSARASSAGSSSPRFFLP